MKPNIVGMRSIDEIPQKYRRVFSDYNFFNSIQTRVFDDMILTNKSVVVSAPTGSGKTVIFELAIIQLLMRLETSNSFENYKMVYVAPTKALCSERIQDWLKKFVPLGLSCLELTGDSDINDFNELEKATLVVTTPEKWDSVTRRWKDNENMVKFIKLFMIDEVHLLNEDIRGPTLETVVSRMKTIQFAMKETKNEEINLRFVAVSATIPNIEDLAVWLGGKDSVSYYKISEEYRPVKLKRLVFGYNSGATGFKFDMSLNYKLATLIKQYSNGKPTLIFCSSRKAVEMSSSVLFKESSLIPLSDNHKSCLIEISKKLHDTKLRGLVVKGIAYHHAGLNSEDRGIIEDAFKKAFLLILVCTNTLATGVNLPAHLVIIKSTEVYIRGTVSEYSESSILQMIGRAGRPQYDVCGIAIIMTHQKNVAKYENLMNGCTPIESHLHKHLAEHLNSEIVLQTVTDLVVAMEWIRSTFLYVRAVECPANYGLAHGMTRNRVEKELEEMCLTQINALEVNDLVIKDRTCGLSIRSTIYGRLMARYYLSFETMKTFRNIEGNETLLQIFNAIIRCKEFSEFKIRVNEKRSLNELNDRPIRFPIKGKIKSVENKISCLIQAHLGNLQIQEPSLLQDGLKMVHLADRISKCLSEYIRLRGKDLNFKIFKALLNSVTIAKSIKARLWENSLFVCKQLKKIGPVYSTHLVNAGKTTFNSLLETDATTLEMILNKPPPIGKEIHDAIKVLPDYEIVFRMSGSEFAEITITQLNEKYRFDASSASIIIGDTDNNLLLYHDKVDNIISEYGKFYRKFKLLNPGTHIISAHLIHGKIVGVDKMASILVNENDDDFRSPNLEKKKSRSTAKTTKPKSKKQTKKNDPKSPSDDVILLEDDLEAEDSDISLVDVEPVQTNIIANGPIRTSLEKYLVPQVKMMKSVRSNDKNNETETNYVETNANQPKIFKSSSKTEASALMNYEYLTGGIPEIYDINFNDSDIEEIGADMMNDNVDLDDKFLRNELELPFEDCVVDLESEEEQSINRKSVENSAILSQSRVEGNINLNLNELVGQNQNLLSNIEDMEIETHSLSSIILEPNQNDSFKLTNEGQSSTNYIELVEFDQDVEMTHSTTHERVLDQDPIIPSANKTRRNNMDLRNLNECEEQGLENDCIGMEIGTPNSQSSIICDVPIQNADNIKEAAQIISPVEKERLQNVVPNDAGLPKQLETTLRKEYCNDSIMDITDLFITSNSRKESELLVGSKTLQKPKTNLPETCKSHEVTQISDENSKESETLFEEEVPNSGVISLDTLKIICRTSKSSERKCPRKVDEFQENRASARPSLIDKPNNFTETAGNCEVSKCIAGVEDVDESQTQRFEAINTVAQVHSRPKVISDDYQKPEEVPKSLEEHDSLNEDADKVQRRDPLSKKTIVAPARLLYETSSAVLESGGDPHNTKESFKGYSKIDALSSNFFGIGVFNGNNRNEITGRSHIRSYQYNHVAKKLPQPLELSQSIFSNLLQPNTEKQFKAANRVLQQQNPLKDMNTTKNQILIDVSWKQHSNPSPVHSAFSYEPLCRKAGTEVLGQDEPINLKAISGDKNGENLRPGNDTTYCPIDLSKPKNYSSTSGSNAKTSGTSDYVSADSDMPPDVSFSMPALDAPLDLSVWGMEDRSSHGSSNDSPNSSQDHTNESQPLSNREHKSIDPLINTVTQIIEDEITCGQEVTEELSQYSQEIVDEGLTLTARSGSILNKTIVLDSPTIPLIMLNSQCGGYVEITPEHDQNENHSLQMKEGDGLNVQHKNLKEHKNDVDKFPESQPGTYVPKIGYEINDPVLQPGSKNTLLATIKDSSIVDGIPIFPAELLNKSGNQNKQGSVEPPASKISGKQREADKNCVFDISQADKVLALEDIVTKRISRKRQSHPIEKYKIPRIVHDIPIVDSYEQLDHGIGNKFLPKKKPAKTKTKVHPVKKEETDTKPKSNKKYTRTFKDLMDPKKITRAKITKKEKPCSSKEHSYRDEYKTRSSESHKRKHEKCKDGQIYAEAKRTNQYKKSRTSKALIEDVDIEKYVPSPSPDIDALLREFENIRGPENAEGYVKCDEIQDFSRIFEQNLSERSSVFEPSPLDFL